MKRLLFLIFLLISVSFPQSGKNLPVRASKPSGNPSATLLNINNFSAWYESNGTMENNPYTGNSGGIYPKGTVGTIYTSGIMWGGYINDGAMDFIQPRVSGQMYNAGTTPGAILGTKTGIVENPNDSTVRIYRIRRDYTRADLLQDAAELNSIAISRVTDDHTAAVRNQYTIDWKEWPAHKGAPFYDAEGDGKYEPKFIVSNGKEIPLLFPLADEPGYLNADQVIWFVANDTRDSLSPWKTRSAGLEEQVTIWGYNRPTNAALGNTIFKKFKFIFKGTNSTKDTTKITKMYLGHWVDPDLGSCCDDYAGVDTSLGLGYVYNSMYDDEEYKKFNLPPPAVGYLLLQGPVVPSAADTAHISFIKKYGFKNLPITSFNYHATGGNYSDPPFTLNGSWQHYSQLMGLPPTPQPPPFPDPVINPISKNPTKFWLDGDPVTSSGWIDGKMEGAGDRRFFLSTGPIEMAVNDTQEVVFALIGASASDRTGNISLLKDYARVVKNTYATGFLKPIPTFNTSVTPLTDSSASITVTANASRGVYKSYEVDLVRSNGAVIASLQLYDDGAHHDGVFNDGIFGNSDTIAAEPALISVRGRATDVQDRTTIFENAVQQVSVPGALTQVIPEIYYDNIDNNRKASRGEYIRFGISVKNTTQFLLRGLTVIPENTLSLGASYPLKNIPVGGVSSMVYDEYNPASYFTVRIPYHQINPYEIPFIFRDSIGNKWRKGIAIPLFERPLIRDSILNAATDIVGSSDAKAGYVLHNPDFLGKQYDLLFSGQTASSVTAEMWTIVPVDSIGPFLTLTTLIGKSLYPPGARGKGSFTLNRTKDSLLYSIVTWKFPLPITSAYIRTGLKKIKTITFTDSIAQGWMTKTDTSEQWHDTLVSKFQTAQLELIVISGGNTYSGIIGDGLIPREKIYFWTSSPMHESSPPMLLASYNEKIVEGFSIYVAMYATGIKAINQIAPDTAGSLSFIHPSRNYFMGAVPPTSWKSTNSDIEIRFNNEVNWAMATTGVGLPSLTKGMRVPFAVYLDTTRVWPVILKKDIFSDTVWRMTDSLNTGEKIFNMIAGIVDQRDVANVDLRYYASTNAIFPPTSNTVKSKLINSANHVARNIYFGNSKGEQTLPPAGTTIKLSMVKSPLIGDIKRITLQRAPVDPGSFPVVPSTYTLENNFPNPFNPTTNIRYGVPKRSYVTLAVFDILGRTVRTLVAGESLEGTFTVQWDGRDAEGRVVASGVYFSQLRAEGSVVSKRMLLLK